MKPKESAATHNHNRFIFHAYRAILLHVQGYFYKYKVYLRNASM